MTAGKIVSTTGSDSWATDAVLNSALYDGQPLTSTVWLRTPSSTPITTGIYIVGVTNTGPGNSQQNNYIGPVSVTLTQTWQQFQVSGTTPNGLVNLILQVAGAGTFTSGEEIDVWGAQLQQNSAIDSVTNILPYSQQWNTLSWGTLSFGQVVADNATNNLFTAPDGTKTGFQVTANSGSTDTYVANMVQNPSQYDGDTVTGSVYLRVPSGSQTINLYMLNYTTLPADIIASKSVTLNTSWQRFQLTGTAGTNLNGLYLQVGGGGTVTNGQIFDVWGAQMEVASSANQYVATLDSPVTVTADSTNILPSSTQVSGQGWYVYNGAVAANSATVTAPDGSNTADVFTATSGSTAGYIYDMVANPAQYDGATVTGSIYLRAANTPQSLLINLGSANASGGTIISTLTASVTTTWQRFDLPPGTAVNGMTLLYLSLGSSSNSQFVSTNPIYIWGTQMEMGSSPGAVNETSNTSTGGTTLAMNGLNESYSYDGFGNMLSAGNFNFVQSYTTSNQLSGWNYDASGNLLIDGFNTGYAYDAEGRVSGEGQYVVGSPSYTFNPATTYFYDADGNRVAKTGSSAIDYIEFGGRQVARLSGGQWTDLIYGVSGLLAEVPGTQAGTPVYRMVDHLGSVAGTLNSSGTLLSSLDYGPFGQIFAGGTADPYVFTGKERDTESGNDYFGARYYASSMGRWMSPDPSNWGVDFYYPQTWNHYSYVGNNPLSATDPNGLWLTPTHKTIIDNSYPGLSKEQRQILKNSSAEVDTHQGQDDQPMHGMESIHNNVWEGMVNPGIAPYDYIQQNEQNAKDIQAAWIASGHTGIAPAALAAFGNALHTVTDEFSPAHEGFQHLHWWGYPWHWREGLAMIGAYGNRRRSAEAAARSEFYKVFGSDLGQQATHEEVTHKIIYNPPPDSTNPQ